MELLWDLEVSTPGLLQTITDQMQGRVMTLGETTSVDDYDPFWLPYQGLLFDGTQFLRAIPYITPTVSILNR